MNLDDISAGQRLEGVDVTGVVTIIAANRLAADAVQLFYTRDDGTPHTYVLDQAAAGRVRVATGSAPFRFDADAQAFQLAVEAKRIDLAYLFDPMMAVHSASIDPLPHQITAVYESMLPRQPLRFVLADDPGAGKTIMAGLYISELILRADARRVLIVAPGSLVEQWKEELWDKFGLEFQIFSPATELASPSGNPLEDQDRLIIRLDQLARREDLLDQACRAGWDLVIFDEAHKLSAHFYGSKLERTKRYVAAERLGAATRHLLLMTATPHNGKEAEFQLFLALLDSDRFYGKFRDGVHKVDPSDLMRRMVKEELVKFDGTPLFPERRAYTVNYALSGLEADLYNRVTHYVQEEMGKADQLNGQRRGAVGFALTALQRRLASSPEAIFRSLERRHQRLTRRLAEARLSARGTSPLEFLADVRAPALPDDDDDLDAEEQETLEEELLDQATAARTINELEVETLLLQTLVDRARKLVVSGEDRKWEELSRILQDDPHTRDADGRLRKLIVFSEHRDTLNYLARKIAGVLGNPDAVVQIHGGVHRDERRRVQALFRSDPETRVLVATDAAGEGVNLQNANLMVNYDLPWNPNRLEQRFGRIHRIGQQEVCHLWNLVAAETREGAVYHRLLEKIRVENEALEGRVFDILGEVFEGASLKDLLVEAIRYGDLPEVRARLSQQVDGALDHGRLRELLDRNALAQESMTPERLFAVRDELEKAEARRLQPHYVRSYFTHAFATVGGTMHRREPGRFEVTHVPPALRDRDRLITGRNRRDTAPVLRRYERVCFEKSARQVDDRPGLPKAELLHPGHPLMLAVTDVILDRYAGLMRQGATLLDPNDPGDTPHLLLLFTHEVRAGGEAVLSKRLQFVCVDPEGNARFAGWAPHLALEPLAPADQPLFADLLASPWLGADVERQALALAAGTLAPEHYKEVAGRRIDFVDRTLVAVNERLLKEIGFWQDRYVRLKQDEAAGKDVRLNLDNVRKTVIDLQGRLDQRKRELNAMRHVVSGTPVVAGAALVIPAGMLARLRGRLGGDHSHPPVADPERRQRTEALAMAAVRRFEEARGCKVVDVSKDNRGWDLSAYPPDQNGRLAEPRFIEVKGRLRDGTTITLTVNELVTALNQADKFILAIVLVDEADDTVEGPYYLRNLVDSEPGWGVSSVSFKLTSLLERAERMA